MLQVTPARGEHRLTGGQPQVRGDDTVAAHGLARRGVMALSGLHVARIPLHEAKLEQQGAELVLLTVLASTLDRPLQGRSRGPMVIPPIEKARCRTRR
jgi:hypothetical protein